MPALPAVHPMQPRFAQAITGVLCLEAIVFDQPAAVAVALGLVLLGLAGPRWSPVAWLFRLVARPPAELEPAAPVRFSQALAAVFLAASVALLYAGRGDGGVGPRRPGDGPGPAVGDHRPVRRLRGLPAAARPPRGGRAPTSATTSGCRGQGPWLVVLTAPGCARCEPLAREIERAADGREVVRVSLAEHPGPPRCPCAACRRRSRSTRSGRVRAARAGRLGARRIWTG